MEILILKVLWGIKKGSLVLLLTFRQAKAKWTARFASVRLQSRAPWEQKRTIIGKFGFQSKISPPNGNCPKFCWLRFFSITRGATYRERWVVSWQLWNFIVWLVKLIFASTWTSSKNFLIIFLDNLVLHHQILDSFIFQSKKQFKYF